MLACPPRRSSLAALILFAAAPSAPSSRASAALTLNCSPHFAVSCDSAWLFTDPIPATTCTNDNGMVNWLPFVTTTSGVCPKVITRTWTVYDYCGNTSSCSQSVTLIDTEPPAALCSGMNLVPNPSFENNVACPSLLSQTEWAAPWYPPSTATPDYFSACATGSLVHVPTNFAGVEGPLTGQAYAGAIVYRQSGFDTNNTYREYIQAPLIGPLVSGMAYRVSFHVSRAESSPSAVAEIGAHFSVGAALQPSANTVLPVTPQVVNPATNLLTGSNGWTLIEGVFVAAGGETHITLGNFLSDAATTATPTTNVFDYTYYYFDEVRVVADCPPSATGKTEFCGTSWTFDVPLAVDGCSGTNVTVTVAGTMTNSGCPLVLTRTWNLTDPCGNSNAWSQTVTLVETSAPSVSCECIADNALSQLTTNSCAGMVPDLSPYGFCAFNACGAVTITQSPPAGTVYGPGTYDLTVRVESCSGSISTCRIPFVVNAPVPQLATPTNLVVLSCSNTLTVSYLVGATGHSGPVVCAPPSGSLFTQGVTWVTCLATSACGGVASNTFSVTVKPPRPAWGCGTRLGIGIKHTLVGGTLSAARTAGPDYPAVILYPDAGDPTNSGVRLETGPAQAVGFTTELTFPADEGAGVDILPPDNPMNTRGIPVLSIRSMGAGGYAVKAHKKFADDPDGLFHAVAVDTNGNLLDSVEYTGEEALTNPVLVVAAQPGVTNCHVDVELDLKEGRIILAYTGTVEPSARHKGWDGCVYGPDRPVNKPKARVIVIPPASPGQPPSTELTLRFGGWPEMVIEEPTLTVAGRQYGDGHVTLMMAYDDGQAQGLEFTAAGPGGGVSADLGYVSNFSFRIERLHGGEALEPYEEYHVRGWPDESATGQLRLTAQPTGAGVDLYVDLTPWGISNVTARLFSQGAPVGERAHLPASAGMPLATLSGFPGLFGCLDAGVWRLSDTNGFAVLDGMDCGGLPCLGDELRIVAEQGPESSLPAAFTRLDLLVAEDTHLRVAGWEASPAFTDIPIDAATATGGVRVSWEAAGCRLQGAETPRGPWFDLGVGSPAWPSGRGALRVFRLRCD